MNSAALNRENSVLSFCGSVLMFAGAAMTLAVFVDRWTNLVVSFPSFWYTSRSFHPLLCVALFLSGWFCHSKVSGSRLAKRGGPVFDDVTVYLCNDCPLCEQALAVLADYAQWLPPTTEVAVDDDEELTRQFRQSVPVVEMDGVIQFEGRVNREVLERLISRRQNQTASVTVREHPENES